VTIMLGRTRRDSQPRRVAAASVLSGVVQTTRWRLTTMPYLTKYHLGEQQAGALLGPLAEAVRDLERRARHYAERLAMSEADRETVVQAHRALGAARAELERIQASTSERGSHE
jgi:hypothetical protein